MMKVVTRVERLLLGLSHVCLPPIVARATTRSVACATLMSIATLLDAVMIEKVGERHASACRYKDEVPEGSRRSARRTHFWPRDADQRFRARSVRRTRDSRPKTNASGRMMFGEA